MKINEKCLPKWQQERAFFLKTGALFGSMGLFMIINDEFGVQKKLNKRFVMELMGIYEQLFSSEINYESLHVRISRFKDVWAEEINRGMDMCEQEFIKSNLYHKKR